MDSVDVSESRTLQGAVAAATAVLVAASKLSQLL